ncbi:hypothetical protein BH09ACT5_BH09ACT5_24360 [soil metagenome]
MSLITHVLEVVSTLPAAIPDPEPVAPPGFEGPVGILFGWLKWGGLALAVAGVMIIGGKMAINVRKGGAAGELGQLMIVAVGCILIGAAASLIGLISGS